MKNTTKKNKKKDPYVYFNGSSIENRMRQDLIDFKHDDAELRKASRMVFKSKGPRMPLFHEMINLCLAKINLITQGKTYYETIHHVDEDKQKQLWVYRTYLFYTFLYLASRAFTHESLFYEVFHRLAFHDLHSQLPHFKLGLFGSIRPTSDIDVGIQYNGHKVSELNYIVHCLEELFLHFTKRSSLDFDIEMYADLITLYHKPEDRFYLDSSSFGHPEFTLLLPYAFNSILRNILLRKEKDGTVITYDDFYQKLQEYDSTVEQFCHLLSMTKKQFYGNLKPHFNKSKEQIQEFLSFSYERQRQAYYKRVKRAEEYKLTHYTVLKSGSHIKTTLTLMCLMADALTYRMESYLYAPTIIHIVRVLQESKDINYKRKLGDIYCKNIPIHEDPFCSIGLVGFMISLFEQIGYLLRFHDNPAKIKKYRIRVEDATHHIQKIYNHRIL